jgi:NNP family nitrate/nitrite transporter-like MFS transporter
MQALGRDKAVLTLVLNTLAFALCFASWVILGVLTTFLAQIGAVSWDQSQIGWLLGVPILVGSITRLPIGLLTDRYGGRIVYTALLLISALGMLALSYAKTYLEFLGAGIVFGLSGASFAVGVASTSLWFKKERQGTALGIFGLGNIGAAATSAGAPYLLNLFTEQGRMIEGWRQLPQCYAVALTVMAMILFLWLPSNDFVGKKGKNLLERLKPLGNPRVWRFGFYYFLLFGGFVALAQWLIPYYVNVYGMPISKAGLVAILFSLPSGVIRGVGGWISDKWGARKVMYAVFGICVLGFFALSFASNVWAFTALLFLVGIMMGLGMGAVYKHIPSYFPNEVGVVGGLVGVLGGLGGFFTPILLGFLLQATGLWTTAWMFFFLFSLICLFWMHRVVRHMERGSREATESY